MNFSEFMRIERDGRDGSRHYVVHVCDPKFSLELAPDGGAPDRLGQGVIKRMQIPNSWAGDYSTCGKLIHAAQEFFARSFGDPAPKSETRRLQT
jgi:hypothetical protein